MPGSVDIDLAKEPLGNDTNGKPVFLGTCGRRRMKWRGADAAALNPETYRKLYGNFDGRIRMWKAIPKSQRR